MDPNSVNVDAENFKNEGNKMFTAGKYSEACELYSKAIEIQPTAIYLGNRAAAYFKLEQYGAAIEDSTHAIKLDPRYVKAYYRRGSAQLALGHYQKGINDFKRVEKMNPNSKEAKEKRIQCEVLFRSNAFAKAIEIEDEKPVSETLEIDQINVEESYNGPRLEGPISLEFVTQMISHLKAQKKLHLKYVYSILLQIKTLFSSLPSLLEIEVPTGSHFTVCGDTHGQYYDFLNIFDLNGPPSPSNPYLFNGDFVDRGSFSVELVLTLFAYKLLYPNHLHLTRGNHETLSMNKMYGFEGEVIHKYNEKCFKLFTEVFNWLPLAAVLGKQIFVTHGGLFSHDGVMLDDIRKISRNRQPPESGIFSDLLWSDPQPFPGRGLSKRGVGVSFGPDVTSAFLKDNKLKMVVRSHEVKEEGYLVEANGLLVTVFSAPNYCDQVGNKGAFIIFDDHLNPTYKSFVAVPHPNVKPMAYASSFLF